MGAWATLCPPPLAALGKSQGSRALDQGDPGIPGSPVSQGCDRSGHGVWPGLQCGLASLWKLYSSPAVCSSVVFGTWLLDF